MRLSPAFEFKASAVQASGEFSGYASTFGGPPDAFGDVIAKGAFASTLAAHKADNTMPALLWSHDPSAPIGKWVEMREDAKGLAVTGFLTLAVAKAQEAHALMRDGALALSIGFRTLDDSFGSDGTRVLKKVDLLEVSAVALPANPRARITEVRSRIQDIRSFETAVRDELGFSVREARRLAAGGWKAFTKDATTPSDEVEALVKHLRSAVARIGANNGPRGNQRRG